MRTLLALGACLAYLVFGLLAGTAHVHESAGHHEGMRGLHLDHAHIGERSGHGAAGHDGHTHAGGDRTQFDDRHVVHHEGDSVDVTISVTRSLDSKLRATPAIVLAGAAFEAPAGVCLRRLARVDPLRGPPDRGAIPARAPPA